MPYQRAGIGYAGGAVWCCCAYQTCLLCGLQGSQIQGSFWRESADKFYDSLEEGKVGAHAHAVRGADSSAAHRHDGAAQLKHVGVTSTSVAPDVLQQRKQWPRTYKSR
jgi:hypothetical protein